jgi:hypothetical protein
MCGASGTCAAVLRYLKIAQPGYTHIPNVRDINATENLRRYIDMCRTFGHVRMSWNI